MLDTITSFWPVIAIVIASVGTYIISKWKLGSTLYDWASYASDVLSQAYDVSSTINNALKPDENGKVELTPDEVAKIKVEIEDFVETIKAMP